MSDSPSLLVRVMTEEGPRYGVVVAEHVHYVEGDPFGDWDPGDTMGPLVELALLAPSVPTKIICVGLNYPAHADESSVAVPAEPLLFFKPPSAVVGPEMQILLPPQSERVDYEAELAIVIGRVIGRTCRNVRPGE
ncbi:MAG: fumarylacetoacetate hydrolase family protein, partial [Anaerolineae bacterium]